MDNWRHELIAHSMFLLLNALKIGHSKLRLDNEYREPLGLFLRPRRNVNRPISVLG